MTALCQHVDRVARLCDVGRGAAVLGGEVEVGPSLFEVVAGSRDGRGVLEVNGRADEVDVFADMHRHGVRVAPNLLCAHLGVNV